MSTELGTHVCWLDSRVRARNGIAVIMRRAHLQRPPISSSASKHVGERPSSKQHLIAVMPLAPAPITATVRRPAESDVERAAISIMIADPIAVEMHFPIA